MAIVDYERRAELSRKKFFANDKISKKNMEAVKRFLNAYEVKPSRLIIFFEKIDDLLTKTPDIEKDMKDRDKINKIFKDIRETITKKGTKMSDSTYATIKNVSIRFVKWLNDGERPKGFSDIKNSNPDDTKRELDEDDMVTWKDAEKMIKATNSIQIKAIMAVQLDGGFRPSEFIDLNYGDIKQDKLKEGFLYAKLKKFKTKNKESRNVILWKSVPHLLRWLQNHPTKKKDDPLWMQEKRNNGENKRYKYAALQFIIKELGQKIKLGKPLDFYNLRHSAVTLAKNDNLPEELGASKFGHSIKFYVNTYGRVSKDKEIERHKKFYGIVEEEERKKVEQNIKCQRCDFINEPDKEVCEKCGSPLSVEKALEVEKENEDKVKQLVKQQFKQMMKAEVGVK